MRFKKKTIYILVVAGVLLTTGTILGINGFFGGGGSIPSDTMTRGLVGYWGMDEGTGQTAYDASGNGNNGTLTNGPKWTTGKYGSGLQFDGVNDYVDAGNAASFAFGATTSFSIEAWIKTNQSTLGTVVGKNEYWDTEDAGYSLGVTGGKAFIHIQDSVWTHDSQAISSNNVNNNIFHHIVGVRDVSSDTLYIYVDGVFAGNTTDITTGTLADSNYGLVIGKGGYNWAKFFNGTIDEVRIYNRALSADEIRYHYNRGGPVAEWKFNEGSGTTTYDSTENNNNGTLNLGTSGNTTTSNAWVSGKYGSALSFDGIDDYVQATVSQGTTTVSLWVNNNGVWQHVEKVSGTYYVNGAPGTPTSYPVYISGSTVQVGKSAASTYVKCLIDDVRIYNYARTADEVRLDYNAGFAARFGKELSSCSEDPGSCMTKGLVGYWGMDEGTGQKAYDGSGNSNNGTLGSSASADSADPRWTTGRPSTGSGQNSGTSLNFDGVNDYVNAGNGASLQTNSFTQEWWMKSNDVSVYQIPLSQVSGGTGTYKGFYQSLSYSGTPNTIRLWLADGVTYYSLTSSALITQNNQWYHITLTYNNTTKLGSIYINGVFDRSTTFTLEFSPSPTNLNIGRYAGGSRYFNGTIDEVRIYNRALSEVEVRYHYNRGGPVAQWKFDEGSGTTTYDAIGNADAIFPTATTNQPTWSSP